MAKQRRPREVIVRELVEREDPQSPNQIVVHYEADFADDVRKILLGVGTPHVTAEDAPGITRKTLLYRDGKYYDIEAYAKEYDALYTEAKVRGAFELPLCLRFFERWEEWCAYKLWKRMVDHRCLALADPYGSCVAKLFEITRALGIRPYGMSVDLRTKFKNKIWPTIVAKIIEDFQAGRVPEWADAWILEQHV